MDSPTDERLPKSQKIRKRSNYLIIQQTGKRIVYRSFLGIIVFRKDQLPARLGITITKKIGGAVLRNRTKRLVKESFRRGIMDLPRGIDLVVIARKSAANLSSQKVFNDLRILASKITQLEGEAR